MIKIITESDLREKLSLEKSIESQENAFLAFEKGEVEIPERIISKFGDSVTLFKPFVSKEVFGLKVCSVREGGVPGLNVLLDNKTGEPLCLMNATYLTALRTAAGSGAAMKKMLPESSWKEEGLTVTVFGSGLQAELHVLTFNVVKKIRHLHIVNRTLENGNKLKEKLKCDSRCKDMDISVYEPKEGDACVEKSHVIITATGAKQSLFDGTKLRKGAFVAAIGSYTVNHRELDDVVIENSVIVADNPAAVAKTTGEFVGKEEKKIHCSLGKMLQSGEKFDEDSVRVFKSIGNSVQDLFISIAAMDAVPEAAEIKL